MKRLVMRNWSRGLATVQFPKFETWLDTLALMEKAWRGYL
jgi:hypothetical protein